MLFVCKTVAGSLFLANTGDPAAVRRRAPPALACLPPPGRMHALPAVRSSAGGPDPPRPQVEPVLYRSTEAHLIKSLLAFSYLQAGPSTIKDLYNQILYFVFWPMSLLNLVPEVQLSLFYVLNLLFLNIISFRHWFLAVRPLESLVSSQISP
jgi:hypothetical protein